MNDLNSLREDKKEIDEEIKELEEIYTNFYNPCSYNEIYNINKKKSKSLAKGISVATKLIEDEISFLESLGLVKIKEDENLEFSTVYQNDTYNLVNDRIKYLRGLL